MNETFHLNQAEILWPAFRLLFSDMNVTYTEVMAMDWDELHTANAALKLYDNMRKKGG
ncbi:hypothetical protein SAMN02799624_04541 [Paenibacillus sp. UNC496MF]|nr:hypothetical protein SAMN02799624_04541 [Paenibacillus sp. UNC496MF]